MLSAVILPAYMGLAALILLVGFVVAIPYVLKVEFRSVAAAAGVDEIRSHVINRPRQSQGIVQ